MCGYLELRGKIEKRKESRHVEIEYRTIVKIRPYVERVTSQR